jgi:hypothetical protein
MDLEVWMDSQCAALGIVLTPAQRPGVLRYLQLVHSMAPQVMGFPLSPADESGNRFVPVAPRTEGQAP